MTLPHLRDEITGLISGTVSYSAAEAFGGVYPVRVVVADSGGAHSFETFDWTITPTVQAPVFSSTLGDQTDNAGDTVDVQADANQPEGDQVIYDESGLPDGLSIDSLSGTITGVIAGDASVNNDVTFTATDQGVTTSENFDWTVNVQHDPTLTSPGDQTNAVGDAADVALTEDDAPGNTPTYVVTGLPDGLGYDPDSGEITGVLASDAASATPYQVTATVSDGGASASTTFNWTVNAVGVTSPGDQYNTAGDTVSLPMTANGTYTYVVAGLPQGLGDDSNTGLISGTIAPTAGSDNPYAVTVTATDGNNTGSTNFNWYVAVPVLADRSDVEGTAVGFQAPAPTDAGPTYSATNLPNGISINSGAGWISGTLAAGDAAAGPYAVTVTTTYTDGTSSSTSFSWTVNPVVTTPPALTNPGSQTSVAGTSVSVDLSAPESASNPLDYEAVGLPDGLYIDPDTGIVSGTPAEDAIQGDPQQVTETVTDSFGNSASQTFNWAVPDSVLTVQGNTLNTTEGQGDTFTVATFFDPDLNRQATDYTATINWGDGQTSDGWMDGSNGSYTVSGDHAYLHPGTLPIQVTVTDPAGGSETVVETASIAEAPLDITGGFQEGEVNGLSPMLTVAVFSDPNTYDLASSYTATINWGDLTPTTTGVVDGEDGQFRITGNHAYALNGTYTVTVTVTDDDGTMATTTSTVTVGDVYANMAQKATFAVFTNTSLTGDPSTYTATINWGDGTTDTTSTGMVAVTGSEGYFSVVGTHMYAATGAYQVNVKIIDGAGNETSGTVTVQAVTAPATGYDGDVATTVGTASDATEAVAVDPGGPDNNGDLEEELETQTPESPGEYAYLIPILSAAGALVTVAIPKLEAAPATPYEITGPAVVPGNSIYRYVVNLQPSIPAGQIVDYPDAGRFTVTASNGAVAKKIFDGHHDIANGDFTQLFVDVQFANSPGFVTITLPNPFKGGGKDISFTVYVVQVKVDNSPPFTFRPSQWPQPKKQLTLPVTPYGVTVNGEKNQTVGAFDLDTAPRRLPLLSWEAQVTLIGPTVGGKKNYGIDKIEVGFHQTVLTFLDRSTDGTTLLKSSKERQTFLDSDKNSSPWYDQGPGTIFQGKAGPVIIGASDSPVPVPAITYENPNPMFIANEFTVMKGYELSVAAITLDVIGHRAL